MYPCRRLRQGASIKGRAEEEDDELVVTVGEESTGSAAGDYYSDDDEDDANINNVGEDKEEKPQAVAAAAADLHQLPASMLTMQQLPIKRRGLSKYYQGKSQSFSSFAEVRCVEDLAKKERRIMVTMKPSSRNYAGRISNDKDDNPPPQEVAGRSGPHNNINNTRTTTG